MNLTTLENCMLACNQASPCHLRAILPRNHAGGIIGFGGQTSRYIQQTYDIFLQVYPLEGAKWGRLVCTKGLPENLKKSWYECAVNLIKNYNIYYDQIGFSINFVFPTELVDLFILRGDIQRIALASKTKILVKHKCLMRSTERIIRVTLNDNKKESLKCFETAVYLLAVIVQENITIALSMPGNIFYVENISDNISAYLNYYDEKDVLFDFIEKDIQHNEIDINKEEKSQH